MHDLPLRRATPADVELVRNLTRAAYAKWVPVIGREPKPMTADYARAVAEHIIEIHEQAGRPIALIELIPTPSHLLIENIAVSPDAQGQNIGTALLHRADEIARSLGLQELQLYTNAAFASNVSFYAKRGFEDYRRDPIPGGGVVVHMRKFIAP